MTEKSLSWQHTGMGRWERDIDEVEQFYTTFAKRFRGTGRSYFAITAHISLYILCNSEVTHSRFVEALQKAWLCLRYDHPTIASWVEYSAGTKRCRKIYEEFPRENPEFDMRSWLDETFHLVETTLSGEEWCNSNPPAPRLSTLFVVKGKQNHEQGLVLDLVLRSQHDIIDGIGSLHLMGNLVRYAARAFKERDVFNIPNFGDEWKHLSPPLKVAADIPRTLTPKREARLKKIVKENTMFRKTAEPSVVPFRTGRILPGCHKRVAFTVPPDVSSAILLACRDLQCSVTHVYHASIAMVMRDMQERRSKDRIVRYISYPLINERKHCKVPYSTLLHPGAVYHSVSGQSMTIDLEVPQISSKPFSVDEIRDEMLSVVDQVKEYYLAMKSDRDHLPMTPSYWQLATPDYPIGAEDPPVPAPNLTPSASISSLGVIDNLIPPQLTPFEIDNPWVTGEELGTGLGLFLGTFRGRISLSASYNDAWHDKTEVEEFIQKCHTHVLTFLSIQSNKIDG